MVGYVPRRALEADGIARRRAACREPQEGGARARGAELCRLRRPQLCEVRALGSVYACCVYYLKKNDSLSIFFYIAGINSSGRNPNFAMVGNVGASRAREQRETRAPRSPRACSAVRAVRYIRSSGAARHSTAPAPDSIHVHKLRAAMHGAYIMPPPRHLTSPTPVKAFLSDFGLAHPEFW